MAMSKNIKWALGIVAAVIVVAAIVVYPKLVVTLPNDGAGAKPNTFKDTYGHRYTEMFLIGGNAITKDLRGERLQHLGSQRQRDHRGFCPAALLDKVDVKAMKEQYRMLAVVQERPPPVDAGLDRGRDGQGAGFRRHESTLGELAGFEGHQHGTRCGRLQEHHRHAPHQVRLQQGHAGYPSWMTRRATRGS